MEGTYQRESKWYRCRFSTSRGQVAADVAGHPRALQFKEELILDELLDFMGRRLFGPEGLRLLRDDLAKTIADDWREDDDRLERLEREIEEVDRGLYRQALRLEEHDDPNHPVVALAKRRIAELSARRDATAEAIAALEAERPDGSRPAEIEAMLAASPTCARRSAAPARRSWPTSSTASRSRPSTTRSAARWSSPPRSPWNWFPRPKRPGRPAGGREILARCP